MSKEVCFFLATQWNTNYELDKDDGQGNIPKEIKPMGGYYEVFFTHGKFSVRVHAVAYAKFGDWEKLRNEKEPAKVMELVRE